MIIKSIENLSSVFIFFPEDSEIVNEVFEIDSCEVWMEKWENNPVRVTGAGVYKALNSVLF